MKCKGTRLLSVSLTLAILLSLLPFLNTSIAQDVPVVSVDPVENFFYTDTTSVGTEFDVTIEAADWPDPGVYSFEFKLYFDASMLEPVVENIGIDPDFWITAFIAAGGLDTGDVPFEDDVGTFLWFSATLLGVGGNVGGGTLAKAGFRIIAEPATGQTLSCDLDLRDVIMVNPSTTPPSAYPEDYFTVQSGIYQYVSPPPPQPLMKASSKSWDVATAEVAGRVFNITVSIEGLIAAEFKLFFEPSILSLTDVTEGDFFKAFGPTFFVDETNANYGVVGILLLPTDEGGYPPDDVVGFPHGDGSLATITFEVINLPEVLTEFPLELDDVIILDADLNELPPRSIEGAVLLAPTKREDLNQDGVINVLDMATFALAFGSYPGHPRWNARADIDQNGKVNILDGVIVTVAFGE